MTTTTAPAPLWAGRTMALLGIVFVALNMRTSVAILSPITQQISHDIQLSTITLGVIGAIPPLAFAVSGAFGSFGAKRLGLERFMIVALALMIAGHLARGLATSVIVLVGGTAVILLAAGIANVLMPPLVKRYFPDRIGFMSSIYLTAMAVGGAIPALISAPIAQGASWRASLGVWAVLVLTGLVPWVTMLVQHRRELTALAASGDEAPELDEPIGPLVGQIWRSRTAWALVGLLALSAVHIFSVFAWLPEMLHDVAGTEQTEGGALIALFASTGGPLGLLVPMVLVRFGRVKTIVACALGLYLAGYAGLFIAPAPLTWLWVLLLGFGGVLFPLCLTLINLRTRTEAGSVALSAFVQGVGYGVGGLGPLVVGVLHDLSQGWMLPLILVSAVTVAGVLTINRVGKGVFVEDELRVDHDKRQWRPQ